MVGYMGRFQWERMIGDLLVFAFFFVPFMKFSPVACGTILLCSLLLIVFALVRGEKLGRLNIISLAVFAFMMYASLSSASLLSDYHDFFRLQFQIRLPLLLFALAFLFRDLNCFSVGRALFSFSMGAYGMALVAVIVSFCSLVTHFDNVPRSLMNMILCFQAVVGMLVHRTYMCFDLLTALLVVYLRFSHGWCKRRIIIFSILFAFTGLFVFLTDARVAFLSFLFLLFCIVVMEMRRLLKGWRFWACIGGVALLLFVLLFQSERVNNVMLSFRDASFSLSDIDPRFRIWNCGWELFKDCPQPLWGYGCGAAKDLLQDEYMRRGFDLAANSQWEMHNQFLEILVENGIMGLLLFMGLLLLPMLVKSSNRRFYMTWIPMLCINLFFEMMLSRTIGTYPIIAVMLLAGMSDEKGDYRPTLAWRSFCLIGALIAVLCVSVKFVRKDKRIEFSTFQRGFERVDLLPGDVPEILKGVTGLRIDNQVESEVWYDWAAMYYRFDKCSVDVSDSISFSLYVYASEDFDADVLQIRAEERQREAYTDSYDLQRKGEWQKLSVQKKGLYGNVVFVVSCSKKGVPDFSSLKGYAIFAQPIVNVIKKND